MFCSVVANSKHSVNLRNETTAKVAAWLLDMEARTRILNSAAPSHYWTAQEQASNQYQEEVSCSESFKDVHNK